MCCDGATVPSRGPSRVVGILKTGDKNLFITRRNTFSNTSNAPIEMEPRCVLDFYVHESAQRRGIGGALFDHFLRRENKNPARLAYDRPSEKLFAFLAKNFSLTKYQPQTNNFVVFDAYFAVAPRPASAAKELRKLTQGRGVGLAAAARAKAAAARAARQEAEKKKTQTPFTRDAASTAHGTARMYGRPPSHTSARDVRSIGTSSIPIVPNQLKSRAVEAGRAETRASSETPNREIARDSGRREIRAERRDSERETKPRDAENAQETTSRGSSPSLYSSGDRIIGDRRDSGATLSPPESLNPKPPRHVPRPPRRATPPGMERLVTNGDSPKNDASFFSKVSRGPASLSLDSEPRSFGESKRSFSSRGEVSVASISSRGSASARTSETLKRDETFRRDRPNPNPPSLRGNSYASFVRGVREMGREGAHSVVANPKVSSRAGFGDVHASDVHASVVPLEDESRQQIRRGEYGQWRAPKEGYYRARAFVKTRRAPTYHYKSVHAPFLSSETGGVARLPDQTGRFANAPEREPPSFALRRLSVRRTPSDENYKKNDARSRSDSYDSYDSYNSYGAQQNVFLARRAAFERAEAQARGDVRFGDFRIPENDEDARSARFRRDEHFARARGAGYRLGPLYGERRDYGADALTRRARQSDAPSAEPELVRVGRRAMGETL